jgi:hypothetical protein
MTSPKTPGKDSKFFSKEELTELLSLHKKLDGAWPAILKAMKAKFRRPYTLPALQGRFYRQSYTQENFWTKDQKDLLVKLKHSGAEWPEIAFELTRALGVKRSAEAIKNQYKRLIDSGEYKDKPGHDFTKGALGEIKKDRKSEQGKIYVFAAVSPMTMRGRPDTYTDDASLLEPNLHKKAWKALENYLARNRAELHILPMRAHMRALEGQPFHYDEELRPYRKNFVTDLSINDAVLKVIEAHLNPQQINSLTGLGQLNGKENKFIFQDADVAGRVRDVFDKNRQSSIIVAHSKQMMDVYPTGFESTPRLVHSTGSMTDPQYIANRVGRLAAEAHTLGFLIVEVRGRKFWIRQVQCDPKTGEFVSMGVRYHADGKAKRERADTIVFGDLHMGAHDPVSLDCAFDMLRYFKPKHAVWHDVHDAKSYTHHDRNKMITFLRNAECFKSLEAEGRMNREILAQIHAVQEETDTEGYIVDSNHNNHLDQYLDAERYKGDRINSQIAHELVVAANRGLNPLRVLIDGGSDDVLEVVTNGYKSKFKWVEPNTDFIRWGVQLGQHGHQGIGGSRGNKHHHSLAYINAIVGHTHKPSIHNGVYTNGTLSLLRLGYNNGPLDWLHAHTVLYNKGMREMIIEIKGEWKLGDAPYEKID